jgi:hypothetical protein
MTIAKPVTDLRRWSNLAVIRLAIKSELPECSNRQIGLMEIADLCRRHSVSHRGRDWNEMRDLILMVGIEWDLSKDSLDAQTDSCLDCVANVLRSGIA